MQHTAPSTVIVGVIIAMRVLKMRMQMADTWLLMLGLLSMTGAWAVLAFTTQSWMMYLMAVVNCFEVH